MNQDKINACSQEIYNQAQDQGLNVGEFTNAALKAIMIAAFTQPDSTQKAIASALETTAKCLKVE